MRFAIIVGLCCIAACVWIAAGYAAALYERVFGDDVWVGGKL